MNTVAFEKNMEALHRILAMLVAMAGFGGLSFSPCGRQCRSEADADWRSVETLPRRLHSLVLSTLRPAEAATRRLIIAMARGVSITVRQLPVPAAQSRRARRWHRPQVPEAPVAGARSGGNTMTSVVVIRPPRPQPSQEYFEIHPSNVVRNGRGTGIVLPSNALRRIGPDNTVEMYLIPKPMPFVPPPPPRRRRTAGRARSAAFPLLDPLRRSVGPRRRKYTPDHLAPRIWSAGSCNRYQRPAAPLPPSDTDPITAARLAQRLAVLGSALNDMPHQALRYARWKARVDAACERYRLGQNSTRLRRSSPLRPGRPPGCRLSQWNPDITHPSRIREIDEVLAHCHSMALFALESQRRDSS